jgi:hypothetical protein
VVQPAVGAKVDLIPLPDDPFTRAAFARRQEMAYYFSHARSHQGIAQRIPCPPERLSHSGQIASFPVLGGLHHDYHRQAA